MKKRVPYAQIRDEYFSCTRECDRKIEPLEDPKERIHTWNECYIACREMIYKKYYDTNPDDVMFLLDP